MAQDIFRVFGICRLAADPELRSLQSGTSVCSLRVAWNNSKKDGQSGEWVDVGNFGNVTIWGKQGENAARFLSKGSRVAIDGRVEHRTWEGENGKREAHQIVADRVQYLDSPKDGASNGGASQTDYAPPADDDIPF